MTKPPVIEITSLREVPYSRDGSLYGVRVVEPGLDDGLQYAMLDYQHFFGIAPEAVYHRQDKAGRHCFYMPYEPKPPKDDYDPLHYGAVYG